MSEPQGNSVAPKAPGLTEALPIWVLSALGLVSSWLGRGLEPALPGSMTGIERWISVTQSVTGALSQLCAAGAVALVLRMSGLLLIERRLGLAFRTLALPAATSVAALCVAAAHDGLDASMQGVLAVACLLTVALTIPFGLLRAETRAIALLLALGTLSSALAFGAVTLAIRAGEAASASGYELARVLSTAGWFAEFGMLVFTVVWLAAARPIRIAALGVACLLFGFAVSLVARAGIEPDASAWTVVVARMLNALERAPSPLLPAVVRYVLSAATGLAALLCLAYPPRAALGALFALCLIGGGSVDVPLSALLLCAAALVVPWLSLRTLDAESEKRAESEPVTSAP